MILWDDEAESVEGGREQTLTINENKQTENPSSADPSNNAK